MRRLRKIIKSIIASNLASSGVVFFLLAMFFSALYFTVDGTSTMDDHFFHYKYSKLLRTEGPDIKNNFNWIKFSSYGPERNPFSTSLFHHLSKPFTLLEDDIAGLKAMDVFWGSLMLALVYYFLRLIRAPYAHLWILLMLTVHSLITWSLSGRNYLMALPLVLFEVLFAAKKRKAALFGLSLLHILFHRPTFFMPIAIVFIVEAVRFAQLQKFYFRNFFVVLAGVVAGMGFYPGFLGNFAALGKFIYSLHADLLTNKIPAKIEGSELLKVSLAKFFERAEILFVVFTIGLAAAAYFFFQKGSRQKKLEEERVVLGSLVIFSILSLAGAMTVSGRLSFFFYISCIAVVAMAAKMLKDEREIAIKAKFGRFLQISVTIFLVIAIYNTAIAFRSRIKEPEHEIFQDAAAWLEERSNGGEVVFLDNWSFFPVLFFYNHQNIYTVGLEPKALYEYDQKLFWKWYNIRYNQYLCGKKGDCKEERAEIFEKIKTVSQRDEFERKAAEEIVESIKKDFGSDFIFSHDVKLNRVLNKNSDLFTDYAQIKDRNDESSYLRVFQIK